MGSLMDRCFGYLAPVFMVTDLELMQTAGMDALVRRGVAGGWGCAGARPNTAAAAAFGVCLACG